MANNKRKWTDEQLVEAVRENYSIYGVLRQIGLKMCGGSHALIKLRIRQLGLNTSHMTGQGWCKGDKHKEFVKNFIAKPLEEILVKDSTYQNTNALKAKLLKKGLLENVCYECGSPPVWREKTLVMRLDHKDGDRCNNEIENLRLLCPNCDSQMPTFAGRNRKKK